MRKVWTFCFTVWFMAVGLSLAMSILILGSLYINPEIWLHDFPADIQEKYGPASPKSLRQRKIFTIPFMLVSF
jgi:hypothetical protein